MYAPFPHTRYIPRFTAIRIGRRAAWGTRLALVAARRSQRDWRPRVTGRTCAGESRDGGIWRGNDTRRQSQLGTVPFELVGTLWLFETVIGGRFSSRTYLNEDNVRRPKKKNQAKNQSGGGTFAQRFSGPGCSPPSWLTAPVIIISLLLREEVALFHILRRSGFLRTLLLILSLDRKNPLGDILPSFQAWPVRSNSQPHTCS